MRERGAIRRRVDEHEGVTLLDHAAFLIEALLQNTGDASSHVRGARGREPSGSLAHQRHRCGAHDDDTDFGRWWLLLRLLLLAAGGDKQGGCSRDYQLNT